MTIRRARPEDFEQWYQLRLSLWPEASQPEDTQEMQEYFSADTMVAFVAEEADGRLVGFLEANIRPYADGCATRNVGYIEGWYVDGDYRQQGIGTALVKAAEEWANGRAPKAAGK